jgi:hypothetical protein
MRYPEKHPIYFNIQSVSLLVTCRKIYMQVRVAVIENLQLKITESQELRKRSPRKHLVDESYLAAPPDF